MYLCHVQQDSDVGKFCMQSIESAFSRSVLKSIEFVNYRHITLVSIIDYYTNNVKIYLKKISDKHYVIPQMTTSLKKCKYWFINSPPPHSKSILTTKIKFFEPIELFR